MKVVMYTTHCPQCFVLAKKLDQKNISYTEIDDIDEMRKLGISAIPMLSVDDGDLMSFKDAVNWINSLEA